ncbi:MAG: MFS transporter [Novosphingobium sp.]|nr:MFS transporter [Novosphingobium sp.]
MAEVSTAGSGLILTQSKPLRLLTLFLFYFTQGFPIGLFFYAVPAWMAADGRSPAETASVVAISGLPWSLKLVNGFLMDRYTYLAMGRRRAWIIGAQSLIVVAFLAGAALSPLPSDVALLSAIGFAANMAVTFQDVGIDGLAVDIMSEDERAKASGIMFGGQVLGISAASAMTGYLFQHFGFATGLAISALIPALVAVYGMVIREREGERHLPWTKGSAHRRNLDIQIEAWWPLLKASFAALVTPLSLLLVPILLVRSLPIGAFEAYHPVLATQIGGWAQSDYTGLIATATLVSGVLGLTVGGWLVDYVGAQRSLAILMASYLALLIAFALARQYWTDPVLLSGMFSAVTIYDPFVAIAVIPICMRMCSPAVAATQFTIYMAVSNFGRPIGAALSGVLVRPGSEAVLYWAMAAIWACGTALALFVRFPAENRAKDEAAEVISQGEGLSPARD